MSAPHYLSKYKQQDALTYAIWNSISPESQSVLNVPHKVRQYPHTCMSVINTVTLRFRPTYLLAG